MTGGSRTVAVRALRRIAALAIGVAMLGAASAVPAGAQSSIFYGMDETGGGTMFGAGGPSGTIHGDVRLGGPGETGAAGDGAYAFNENVGSCSPTYQATGTGEVVIPYSSAYAVGAQSFEFGAWVDTTYLPLADSGATGNCDFDLWRQGGRWKMELIPLSATKPYGVARCSWQGVVDGTDVHVFLKGTSDLTDGAWHHVICARTASGEELIVDGAVEASSPVNVGVISSKAAIYVATQAAQQDFYEGALDDLSFSVASVPPMTGPAGAFNLGTIVGSWMTVTGGTAYEAQVKDAFWRRGFTAPTTTSTAGTDIGVASKPGRTYCVRAASVVGGVTSSYSTWRCSAMPVPASFKAWRLHGFARSRDPNAYMGRVLTATRAGARAVLKGVNWNELGLVARLGPGEGKVRVYIDGRYKRTLNLDAAAQTDGTLLFVARSLKHRRTSTVRLVSANGNPVYVEGLGVWKG